MNFEWILECSLPLFLTAGIQSDQGDILWHNARLLSLHDNSRTFPLITTVNITMQFGAKPLFENISVKFSNGNCYGLIGANLGAT